MDEWFRAAWEEEREANAAFRADVGERLTGIETWITREDTAKAVKGRLWKAFGSFVVIMVAVVGLVLPYLFR